jgi:hypothetical protein
MSTTPNDGSVPAAPSVAGTAVFREWHALRVLEAAAAIFASPFNTATAVQIETLQTAARAAMNPQLRLYAQQVLDAWANREEPALAALVAGDLCDGASNVVDLASRRPYDPLRVHAFDLARQARDRQRRREHRAARPTDALDDAGRPCDTEVPA